MATLVARAVGALLEDPDWRFSGMGPDTAYVLGSLGSDADSSTKWRSTGSSLGPIHQPRLLLLLPRYTILLVWRRWSINSLSQAPPVRIERCRTSNSCDQTVRQPHSSHLFHIPRQLCTPCARICVIYAQPDISIAQQGLVTPPPRIKEEGPRAVRHHPWTCRLPWPCLWSLCDYRNA